MHIDDVMLKILGYFVTAIAAAIAVVAFGPVHHWLVRERDRRAGQCPISEYDWQHIDDDAGVDVDE